VHAVLLDRAPQRRALAEDVRLADELRQAGRSQPLRERRDLARVAVGGVGEEVTHDGSMLRHVSAAETWSGASYERIAETFTAIHDRVVEALAIEPGTRLLDVACGTGGVALRAARAGADVTGIDISADQLAKARSNAEEEGLQINFDEGDCQELPYGDAEFDAVASAFGAIFAPDHKRTAAELARVCRPGGRLAVTAWPADHWSETHARAGRTFVEDVDAREWANEEHVRGLLGDAFELELQTGEWRVEADSGEELWELASTSMPPLRTWLAEQSDEARAQAEKVYLEALAPGVLARNYVLVLGTRR
jgi:2-polyprenyl-3-methyl-5-hydroxy-6-metoxy-1,4-benzoquinol methylase